MEVKSSNEEVFSRIYEKSFPLIMKVAYHITYHKDIAEEICQESFIRFYDKAMVFANDDEALYWLIRVTKNLALNYIKRKAKEKVIVSKMQKKTTFKVESGEDVLIKKDTTKIVKDAIDNLPEKLRTAIVLREYGQLSYEQIGRVLQVSESNAKVRVHRARKALLSYLEGENI